MSHTAGESCFAISRDYLRLAHENKKCCFSLVFFLSLFCPFLYISIHTTSHIFPLSPPTHLFLFSASSPFSSSSPSLPSLFLSFLLPFALPFFITHTLTPSSAAAAAAAAVAAWGEVEGGRDRQAREIFVVPDRHNKK